MGYTVPDWKQSIKQNIYPVIVGEKTYELPKSKYITGEQAERLQRVETSGESLYDILDDICDGLGSALRPIPVTFTQEMIEDWQKDSGVTVGESVAS